MKNDVLKVMQNNSFMIEGRIFGFSIIFIMLLITIYYIITKRKVSIRLLPQVEAMREGIGRCAEMGRPLVFTYGNPEGMDFWTVSAFNLLRYSAKYAAELGVKVVLPMSSKPKALITHAVAKDIMRNVYYVAETPEAYDEANFRYTGINDQTWGLTVAKILYEEEPAAHYYTGFIPGFGVLFGEVGRSIPGCLSIGSSFYLAQIAVIAISADYIFINQDLIAASAYVTEDPAEGGFLRTIDSIALLWVILIVGGSLLALIGIDILPLLGV